jgi:hypothetical protein
MDAGLLLDRILDDEGLTSGLDEAEAMALIKLLTTRVRQVAEAATDAALARRQTEDLCRRARQIGRVAVALRDEGEAAARSMAERHNLRWPAGAGTPANLIHRMAGALDRHMDLTVQAEQRSDL